MRANMPAKTPDNPLREINREDRSIIERISRSSSRGFPPIGVFPVGKLLIAIGSYE
jgi:hypothetical protein